jgi:hypothetical protein
VAWEWELTDLDGVTVGLLQPRNVKVTRVLNGPCAIELEVDGALPVRAPEILFDPFGYEAGTLQAANPARWRSSQWGDPDAYATGDGTVQTNRADAAWAGASSVEEFGDGDVTLEVTTAPVTNGSVELYALQSQTGSDFSMLAVTANVATGNVVIYQVSAPGAYTSLGSASYTLAAGDRLTLRVLGASFMALVNDEPLVTATHSLGRSTGTVGFEFNDANARLGSFTVRPAPVAPEASGTPLTTAAVVRGWRAPAGAAPGDARVLRATGKVRSALQLAAARDALDTLTITAGDGFAVLADRALQNGFVTSNNDPAAIVLYFIQVENARAETGLEPPPNSGGGPNRDRTYDKGKNVAEAIQQLAEVDDGFYFRVDPLDDGARFSEFVILYPDAGSESTAAFEFGEGTRANLAKIQVDVRPPINYAMAFGAGTGDAQLVSTATDAASIATYGLVDVVRSFSDVVEQATLDQHALDMLRPNERRTFKVEVASSADNGELATPSPWDDFDVGDTVALTIRTSALTYSGRALVKSFTVTVDADGVERLSSLDFQQED